MCWASIEVGLVLMSHVERSPHFRITVATLKTSRSNTLIVATCCLSE